jgi:hypothetical protein
MSCFADTLDINFQPAVVGQGQDWGEHIVLGSRIVGWIQSPHCDLTHLKAWVHDSLVAAMELCPLHVVHAKCIKLYPPGRGISEWLFLYDS